MDALSGAARSPDECADVDARRGSRWNRFGRSNRIYGGSLELSVCDKKKLISFLERNAAQREAWLSVLGVNDVASYVNSLSQVILAADTRVTNHGFEENKATPLQSVLQAGTAVLVDERGVPRVRCQCGNPLLEPVLSSSTPTYTGEQWPGFNPDRIIVVQPAPAPITQITVINVADGEPLVLPFGDETEPPVTTTRPSSTSRSRTSASPTLRPNEVLGYWTGDWGDMLLNDGGGGVIVGAYAYDDGVLTGTFVGNSFRGRWCEQPRASGTDQGPVEFTFVEVGGQRQIDGRWKYDSDGAGAQWREDWDLTEQSSSSPPADLVQRTKDPSLRCT